MDIDKIDRFKVQPAVGKARSFDSLVEAEAFHRTDGKPKSRVRTATVYVVRYRDPSRRQRKKTFTRVVDAEEFALKNGADLRRGQWVDPNPGPNAPAAPGRVLLGQRPFREFAEEYRANQIHQPLTARSLESMLRIHVYPVIGDVALNHIRQSHINRLVKGLTGVLAPSTIHTTMAHMGAIFKAAVADSIRPDNPCVGVKLPEKPLAKVIPWPIEAVRDVADAIADRYRAFVLYGAKTGCRHGEIAGLTLSQLHMLERKVDVQWQAQVAAGHGLVLCRPKTRYSIRTIPLPESLLEDLAAHMARYPPVTIDIVHRERDGRTFVAPEQFVFTTSNLIPIRESSLSCAWRKAVTAAKVDGTPHDLRHHYASALIRAGESVKVVQERLGHGPNGDETMRTYGHLWEDADDTTRSAIDGLWTQAGFAQHVHRG